MSNHNNPLCRIFHLLKEIDLFKQTLQVRLTRKKPISRKKLKQYSSIGSIYGGLLTLIVGGFLIFYLFFHVGNMLDGSLDKQRQIS